MAIGVILIVFLLIMLWLAVSYVRMQRSLRWWQGQQVVRQRHQAEVIRDGVVQDSFALRRSLELALMNSSDRLPQVESEKLTSDWLAKIEMIQSSLETLTNHLAPPYLNDHLPLSVRFLLKQWQQQHPNVSIKTTLPDHWCQPSRESSQIVLAALEELLRITELPDTTSVILHASLQQKQHDQIQELIIHMSLSNPLPPDLSTPDLSKVMSNWDRQELSYLKRAFHCLTSGRFYSRRNGEDMIWYFRWRSRPGLL